MDRPAEKSLLPFALVTLAWALSLEAFRALLPLIVFGVRDRFRWSALGAEGSVRTGALALALFALAFFAGPILRRLGAQRTLNLGLGLIVLGRLGLQLWPWDPLGDLLLVVLVVFGLFLLPLAVAERFGGRLLVRGILAGGGLDAILHGAFGTLDLLWREDLPSLLLALALLATLALCWWTSRSLTVHHHSVTGTLPWMALGPFLFLQLLQFGNLARLTVLTGWSQDAAWLWLGVGQIAAFLSVVLMQGRQRTPPQALALGVILAAALSSPWPQGEMAAVLLLGGQALSALLLALALDATGKRRASPSLGLGMGMMFLVLLFFLYYGSYDLTLPLPNTALPVLAALGLAVSAWAGSRQPHPEMTPVDLRPVALLAFLLVFPALRVGGGAAQPSTDSAALPIRLMTYNLHCGFDTQGDLTLEAQARVIEESGAEVVALQEVSRGWVMNGSVDMLAWLARRLDMGYAYAPTADPLWGNAILSRRPLSSVTNLPFEHGGVHIHRGLVSADLHLEEGAPLTLMATHFHHRRKDSHIRQEETQAVLDFWQNRPRAVVLGDLNATT